MTGLGVFWGGKQVGLLERVGERSREYTFRYTDRSRAISVSLPTSESPFTPADSRPFFEGLLPEGVIRQQVAEQLKLAASDSFGLLGEIGRDCAGALQILETKRMSEPPAVRWLDAAGLDELITELPRRPLGMRAEDGRLRLSLAGVQRKAVLVSDGTGRFGEPLNGMPSTHILKPDLPGSEYPGLAVNEYFCMRLAARCGLAAAEVDLMTIAGRPVVAVRRYDRDTSAAPPGRLHQEDLCQALGLTPDFKYQQPGWSVPSYAALAGLLNSHSLQPGRDRLAGAQAAVFNFLVGNSDAHARNISLLLVEGGVRLAPLYDVVATGAYPQLNPELALSIGDQHDPQAVGPTEWNDLASDFGLNAGAFERRRYEFARSVRREASAMHEEARAGGWHDPVIASVIETIARRAEQL